MGKEGERRERAREGKIETETVLDEGYWKSDWLNPKILSEAQAESIATSYQRCC